VAKKATKKGKSIISGLARTIDHFFPNLWQRVGALTDTRKKQSKYSMAELIGGGIALFLLKQGSRNALNQSRLEANFTENYQKIFKLKLPHMDTVDDLMRILEASELEQLKRSMLNELFDKKVLHKWKFLGKHFLVAVDGTGVHSYSERHCDNCLTKTYSSFSVTEDNIQLLRENIGDVIAPAKALIGVLFKKEGKFLSQLKEQLGDFVDQHRQMLLEAFTVIDKVSYSHQVLEAKLVCANGFSISLGTQWIENPEGDFDKQDCESKAFKRLANQLKRDFPRLPICIVADGLYPNEPFFETCKNNQWEYVCTFKMGNLPSLRKEIDELKPCNPQNLIEETVWNGDAKVTREYTWITQLSYRNISLNWVRCVERKYDQDGSQLSKTVFEYVISCPVTEKTIRKIIAAGRLRQKIENEGFNTQKNLGYGLEHKYSRVSLQASKNYYQCLQIAHMINQLLELSTSMKEKIKSWGTTLKHCWVALMGFMQYGEIDTEELAAYCKQRPQYRYQV